MASQSNTDAQYGARQLERSERWSLGQGVWTRLSCLSHLATRIFFSEPSLERIRQQIDEIRLTKKASFHIISECQEILAKEYLRSGFHEGTDLLFSVGRTGDYQSPQGSTCLIRLHSERTKGTSARINLVQ